MKTIARIAMALAGMTGLVASAVAGNRGPLLFGSIESDPIDSALILSASSPQVGDTLPMDNVVNASMQTLVVSAMNALGFKEGETNMLITDVPDAPPSTPPVVILAQSTPSQQGTTQQDHTLGVCGLVELIKSGQAEIAPWVYAGRYFETTSEKINPDTAKITVLQQPEHGYFKLDSRDGWARAKYVPNSDFVSGNDSFVIQVEDNGLRVKIHYFMTVTDVAGDTNTNPVCQGQNRVWKISQDANGNPTLTLLAQPASATPDTTLSDSSLNDWLSLAHLDGKVADISGINITFADLPGSAVGQTVGSNITLDTSAAGHGWYVDANPWDNSEYLATSNPYEWVARAGSAAEGKMDLLSVLLHEYGHALGIEHSMDSHNYMGTTLTPGVRRMPSAEELALMQQLVGQVKEGMVADASTLSPTLPLQGGGGQDVPNPALPLSGGFLAFLGRRKESGFGIQDVFNPQPPAIRPQYAVAANAAFTGLDSPTGWNTLGSVGITNNAATLNEVSATTRKEYAGGYPATS